MKQGRHENRAVLNLTREAIVACRECHELNSTVVLESGLACLLSSAQSVVVVVDRNGKKVMGKKN